MLSKRGRLIAACAVFAAVIPACDNPVGAGDDHVVPASIRITSDGAVILTATRQAVTGTLSVTAGVQSDVLTVSWLDSTGAAINPGSEYYLSVLTADPGVALWVPQSAGSFTGRVSAVSAGTVTLTFRWVHGPVGGGHSELDIDVPVTVTATALN